MQVRSVIDALMYLFMTSIFVLPLRMMGNAVLLQKLVASWTAKLVGLLGKLYRYSLSTAHKMCTNWNVHQTCTITALLGLIPISFCHDSKRNCNMSAFIYTF